MYIKFLKIDIEGFQAIKQATLSLDKQGVVQVQGINKYEQNANSNGSGKSSCFEAILWALFGKTSVGISDPSCRYLTSGCCVSLDFVIDKTTYNIKRFVKYGKEGSGLRFLVNDEDKTCRNKTDTDKLIKDTLPFTIDTFLSIFFLSQGFNSRLSILTPSGRNA